MRVSRGKKEDFVEVHKLLLSVFPNARAEFGEKDGFFVAREGGELVGFAHFLEDGKRIILRGLGVAEKTRARGTGGALLDAVIAHAKKRRKNVYLKTKARNPALRLYCRKGFCFRRLKGETLTMLFRVAN